MRLEHLLSGADVLVVACMVCFFILLLAAFLGTTRRLFYGGLAQLARAPALQAGGQRFESVILHLSFFKDAIFDILIHKTVIKF